MNVSSAEDHGLYPTPEFQNLLITVKRLRREVHRLVIRDADAIVYNRVLKNLDALDESINRHFNEFYALERALAVAASARLTKKQRMLLRWLAEDYMEEEVYTALIERVSDELSIPKSTVRWNLRGLREAGLVMAGDKKNKGIPVRLTNRGRFMVEYAAMDGT